MRLYNYLNEMDVIELSNMMSDLNDEIHKKCKPYLKLIQGKNPLYRGMKDQDSYFGIKSVRKNRKSRFGTDKETFKQFNEGLENNGHNRRDTTVIATTSSKAAEHFGKVFYIFPIGKISYTFLKAKDVNLNDTETGGIDLPIYSYFDDDVDSTTQGFENYFVTDTNFDKAYNNGWEIGFECDNYYYVDINRISGFMKGDTKDQRFKG